MSTELFIQRDVQSEPTTGVRTAMRFSDTVQRVLLVASTPLAVTVPFTTDFKVIGYFKFAYGTDLFILPSATPTIALPTTTVTVGTTTLLLNGEGKNLVGGQTFQLLTEDTGCYVTIEYYTIY